jgi:hypothetical protein
MAMVVDSMKISELETMSLDNAVEQQMVIPVAKEGVGTFKILFLEIINKIASSVADILDEAKVYAEQKANTAKMEATDYAKDFTKHEVGDLETRIANRISEIEAMPGPRGEDGKDGATPNITATVSTGEAGTQASVTKTGTLENPVFNFVIPKGERGEAGTATSLSVRNYTLPAKGEFVFPSSDLTPTDYVFLIFVKADRTNVAEYVVDLAVYAFCQYQGSPTLIRLSEPSSSVADINNLYKYFSVGRNQEGKIRMYNNHPSISFDVNMIKIK